MSGGNWREYNNQLKTLANAFRQGFIYHEDSMACDGDHVFANGRRIKSLKENDQLPIVWREGPNHYFFCLRGSNDNHRREIIMACMRAVADKDFKLSDYGTHGSKTFPLDLNATYQPLGPLGLMAMRHLKQKGRDK